MAGEYVPINVRETTLWKRLSQPFVDSKSNELSVTLAQVLPDICRIASDRMKLMPAFHPEFTLRDDTHLLRVTELMAQVMPPRVLEKVLNPVEIAVLILAAHFHDLGMIVDAQEASQIRQSEGYMIARQNWLIENEGFNDAIKVLKSQESRSTERDRSERIEAEFEQALFARYLRDSHASESAAFVKRNLGKDPRLRVGTGNLADSLALLCKSHNLPPERISDGEGFHFDKAIGAFPANLAYLAVILRLADILDFDRERTPDEFYRSINFSNPVKCRRVGEASASRRMENRPGCNSI